MRITRNNFIIITSLVISFMIVMTGVSLSSTGTYQVPHAKLDEGDIIPAQAVSYHTLSKHERKQIDCLTVNIYREAGYEPKVGWVAVGFVTMNRLFSGNYADSVCGVVYQKTGSTYQFSWVGMSHLPKINQDVYDQVRRVATSVYMGYDRARDVTDGATFYHADYVQPGWRNVEKTRKIGTHIFYRSSKDI
jgi:spore germination cell wall hydrolase CwlJ-like protein